MYNFFVDVWIWSFAIFGMWKLWDETAVESIAFLIEMVGRMYQKTIAILKPKGYNVGKR